MGSFKMKKDKYTLIVDCGKPYEMEFNEIQEVLCKIIDFKKECENKPYCDIMILKNNKDITKEVFKDYSLSFEDFFDYVNNNSEIGFNDCYDFKPYWENLNTNKLNLKILKNWLK
jgi:hypothetical protein